MGGKWEPKGYIFSITAATEYRSVAVEYPLIISVLL